MRVVLALLLVGGAACSVDPVQLQGRSCPCVAGWICDSTNHCVLPDGSAPDGDGGGDGSEPYAHWPLDEGAGSSAYDSSGNTNTITLLNAPTWLSGADCVINGCLSFNGTNQAGVTANTLNLSDTNVVTVALWMYWDSFSSNDSLALEFSTDFNTVTTGFMIDPNSGSFVGGTEFEASFRGNVGYNQTVFVRPSAAAWHHYAFVFDKGAAASSQVTPYVDGAAVTYTKPSSAANTNNFGSDTLYLMSRGASSLFGQGRLDDVRIYKRALLPSEIVSLATHP